MIILMNKKKYNYISEEEFNSLCNMREIQFDLLRNASSVFGANFSTETLFELGNDWLYERDLPLEDPDGSVVSINSIRQFAAIDMMFDEVSKYVRVATPNEVLQYLHTNGEKLLEEEFDNSEMSIMLGGIFARKRNAPFWLGREFSAPGAFIHGLETRADRMRGYHLRNPDKDSKLQVVATSNDSGPFMGNMSVSLDQTMESMLSSDPILGAVKVQPSYNRGIVQFGQVVYWRGGPNSPSGEGEELRVIPHRRNYEATMLLARDPVPLEVLYEQRTQSYWSEVRFRIERRRTSKVP